MLFPIVSVFEEFFGVRRRCAPPAPRTRMTIPSVVPPLPDLLRQLRALRDDLDYYVEQDGWVLLLAHDPSKPRVHEARKMLELGLNTFDNLIMADGFSILAMLEPHATWSGRLVQCAQNIVDKATYRGVEKVHDARVREADGTMTDLRGEAHLRDRLTSDSRSDHRILFRGKRSFSGSEIHRHLGRTAAERTEKRLQDDFHAASVMMRRYPNLPIVR